MLNTLQDLIYIGAWLAVPAVLALVLGLVGFPVYFWVRDRHRRGERVTLLQVVAVGLLGAAVIGVFFLPLLLPDPAARP